MPPACSQSADVYALACQAVDDDVHRVTLTQKALQAFLSAEPKAAIPAIDHLLRPCATRPAPNCPGKAQWRDMVDIRDDVRGRSPVEIYGAPH
jgi:hypothetical protein